MSFLAAELGHDPAARARVERMLAVEPLRADGRCTIAEEHGFVVGVAAASFELGEVFEPGIERSADGRWLLAFEGRLDERDELARELELPLSSTDRGLAIAAVARWGEGAAGRLRGDFAWIALERSQRRVLLARDRMGVRALYYAPSGRAVLVGSIPRGLVDGAGLPARPNPLSLIRAAAGRPVERNATLLDGVVPVPAAHTVSFELDGGTTRARAYWCPDPWRVDEGSRAAHAERLGEALRAAVSARTATQHRSGTLASGGLDSSSVAALAASSPTSAGHEALLLSIVTPGLPCDESRFVRALAGHTGLEAVLVEPPREGYRPSDAPRLELFDPSLVTFARVARTARDHGVTALMTGEGSDELQAWSGLEIEDALRRGAPLAATRFAGLWDEPGDRLAWARLARAMLRIVVPGALRRWRRRGHVGPAWLTARGRRRLEEADAEFERETAAYAHPSPVRRALCADLTHGTALTHTLAANQRVFAAGGVELRHPFLDARVVDTLLELPTGDRTEHGLIKPTLRDAMARHLPPGLRWRRHPTDYSAFHERAFESARPAWLGLLGDSRLAQLGLIDPAALLAALNARGPSAWHRWDLVGTLTAEAWLRGLVNA